LGIINPSQFWLSNRSGKKAQYESFTDVNTTTDAQLLVDNCSTVILCVPPDQWHSIAIQATDKLFISVMAGVTLAQMKEKTGSDRIVRAMSSPAAEQNLAYSPWIANPTLSENDKFVVNRILSACGSTDELQHESHVDVFTAMTGPVPGFVAYFAKVMSDFATANGIDVNTADRSVRQLFLGAAAIMSEGKATPADHVKAMIDYDGTTAAGLRTMSKSSIASEVSKGLTDSMKKVRTMTN